MHTRTLSLSLSLSLERFLISEGGLPGLVDGAQKNPSWRSVIHICATALPFLLARPSTSVHTTAITKNLAILAILLGRSYRSSHSIARRLNQLTRSYASVFLISLRFVPHRIRSTLPPFDVRRDALVVGRASQRDDGTASGLSSRLSRRV